MYVWAVLPHELVPLQVVIPVQNLPEIIGDPTFKQNSTTATRKQSGSTYNIATDICFWTGLQGTGNNSKGQQIALRQLKSTAEGITTTMKKILQYRRKCLSMFIWVEVMMIVLKTLIDME